MIENCNIVFMMLFSACGKNIVFDVGFAIDGSNSIDDNEYRLTKDFVKDVIRIFTISEHNDLNVLGIFSQGFLQQCICCKRSEHLHYSQY